MNSDKAQNIENKELKEIDLFLLFKSILREKKLLFLIVIFTSFSTSIYSLLVRPIWEGSFNIVIKEKSSFSPKSTRNTQISKIIGGYDFNENITQKLILKSPSVLLPVFEYRKDYYKNKKNENLSFKSWLNDELFIDYEEGSTVLNIKYQNEDKKLILDVLNLISKKYKDYSKKEQIRNLTKTRKYLENQKKIMEARYLDSQKEYNKFTIENGLGNIDGFVGLGESQNFLENNTNLSQILGENGFSNLLRKNSISDNKSDAGQRYQSLFNKLELYESQYIDLSSKLKPKSKILTELKNKIDTIKSALKRPNEILLEYKKLTNIATRDARLLSDIEYNLEIVKLQQVQAPDAWEMISIPTIDRDRVFPKRTNMVLFSMTISTIAGCLLILLKERLSGIIYDINKIEISPNCSILTTLIKENPVLSLQLFDKTITNYEDKEIGLIFINDYEENYLFEEICKDSLFKKVELKDKTRINELGKIIIFIEKGKITYNDIYYLNKYISIYQEKIIGWVYIDSQI